MMMCYVGWDNFFLFGNCLFGFLATRVRCNSISVGLGPLWLASADLQLQGIFIPNDLD